MNVSLHRSGTTANRTALGLLLLVGCSGDEPDLRTGQLRSTRVDAPPPLTKEAPPAYRFEFLKPTIRSFQPGEPIPCDFSLQVPEGSRKPAFVILQLLQGDTAKDTESVKPKGDPINGTYLFETRMDAPKSPGRYRLRVQAIIAVHYLQGSQVPETRHTYVYSPPLDFTVTKGR